MRYRLLTVLLCSLLLVGCSNPFASEEVPEPVGIGPDRNELKRSPCACIEVEQDYSAWMSKTG